MEPRGMNQKEGTQPLRAPRAKALLVHEDTGDLQYYFNILEGYGYWVRGSTHFRKVSTAWGTKSSTSLW